MAVLEEVTGSPMLLAQGPPSSHWGLLLQAPACGAQVMMKQGRLPLQCPHTPVLSAAEGAGQAVRVEGWKAQQQEEREQREVLLL